MSFSGYPEYKQAGLEWLDKVPVNWGVVPIKYMATEPSSIFIDGDWIESKDISSEGIRYITTGNIGEGAYKEQGDNFISEETFTALNCTEVFPGDILISRLNHPVGRSAIIPDLGSRIVTSVDNVIFRPDSRFHKQFLIYMFSCAEYFRHTGDIARGTTMQRISRGLLGNIRVLEPSFNEQTQIARFLDHEVGKIDALIAEQEKLIALLKEKRQAVISHAVTKGLNPDVPMKDSGVEWLGQVPEHWVVKKLKFVAVLQNQKNDESDFYVALENIESWTGRYIETEADYSGAGVSFEEGYILFGKLRPYLAKVYLTGRDGIAFGDLLTFRPVNINPHFLFFSMLAEHFITAVDSSTYGSKMPRASADFITSMFVCVPPPSEQVEIADYIYSSIKSFDDLSVNALNAIGLMQERRSALISAAVTGKIDVRGWQPPAAQ